MDEKWFKKEKKKAKSFTFRSTQIWKTEKGWLANLVF